MLAPEVVHYGLAGDVVESRKKVLQVAFEAHPERFVRGVPLPAPCFTAGGVDQSTTRNVGRQKTATVIFNSECPKVVDRFRLMRSHFPSDDAVSDIAAQQRMANIAPLKGLAILLIVAFHICGQVFNGEPKWFRPLTYQGVNVFFLLSGLGLTYSVLTKQLGRYKLPKWRHWYLKRAIRILPLYWLVLLMTLLIYKLDPSLIRIGISKHSGGAKFDFFAHLFLIHIYFKQTYYSINVAWWFLGALFHFYLLFPVIINIYKHNALQIPLIVMVAVFFCLNKHHPIIRNQIAASFSFFFLGIVLTFLDINRINRLIVTNRYLVLLVSLSLSTFAFCCLAGNIPNIFGRYAYDFFAFSACCSLYILSAIAVSASADSTPLKAIVNIFNNLGSYSYALFLLHWGFIFPIVTAADNAIIGIIVYGVFSLLLSILFTRIDKKLTCPLLAMARIQRCQ